MECLETTCDKPRSQTQNTDIRNQVFANTADEAPRLVGNPRGWSLHASLTKNMKYLRQTFCLRQDNFFASLLSFSGICFGSIANLNFACFACFTFDLIMCRLQHFCILCVLYVTTLMHLAQKSKAIAAFCFCPLIDCVTTFMAWVYFFGHRPNFF